MHHTLLWIREHRGLMLAAVAAFFWIFANWWYWRGDWARIRRENAPKTWSVDMASKTSKGGRKVIR